MWQPVRIFRAVIDALEKGPIVDWRAPENLDTSSHGLDEALIAETLAADGIRPYWRGQRTVPMESIINCVNDKSAKAEFRVISSDRPDDDADLYPPGKIIAKAKNNQAVQKAAHTVVDAGLARLQTGPHGPDCWTKAALDWRPAARIMGPTATIDDHAMGFLGLEI